jgi:hypothetical protein
VSIPLPAERLRNVRYLFLSYVDEAGLVARAGGRWEAVMAEIREYESALHAGGHLLDSRHLHPAHSAATVRRRQGRTTVTEGPRADSPLRLGGFVLVEAEDLNQAIRLASNHPAARLGCVEVRPVEEPDWVD